MLSYLLHWADLRWLLAEVLTARCKAKATAPTNKQTALLQWLAGREPQPLPDLEQVALRLQAQGYLQAGSAATQLAPTVYALMRELCAAKSICQVGADDAACLLVETPQLWAVLAAYRHNPDICRLSPCRSAADALAALPGGSTEGQLLGEQATQTIALAALGHMEGES